MRFIDEVRISLRAGHGGHGCVSFRREKYQPQGGPDGGNGGQGGGIHIQAHSAVATLGKLLETKIYQAEDGQPGRGRKRNGAKGNKLILYVPIGTEVLDAMGRKVLADLCYEGADYLAASGGKGGLGNCNFATSVSQAPEYAQPGQSGSEITLFLRLKLLADVGLLGLPNAGKSTLLAAVSGKKTEIADYPFTTLTPSLGVVFYEDHRRLYLADIPGIVEGASRGIGLGLSFLRHIERVNVIVYLLDAERFSFHSEVLLLQKELHSYNAKLLTKPALVAINKFDLLDYDRKIATDIRKELLSKEIWKTPIPPSIIFLSAKQNRGLHTFKRKLFALFAQQLTQAEQALSRA